MDISDILPEYVPLPCKNETLWKFVKEWKNKKIKNFNSLLDLLRGITGCRRSEKFKILIEAANDFGSVKFFDLVPKIFNLVFLIEEESLQKKLKFLRQRKNASIEFTKKECAGIIANGFFCTFHKFYVDDKNERLVDGLNELDCFKLYNPKKKYAFGSCKAKLLMILNYFDRVTADSPKLLTKNIVIERKCMILEGSFEKTIFTEENKKKKFGEVEVLPTTGIEKVLNSRQADFANKYIGGASLRNGGVQEEIRFCISPETLVSILICPVMLDEEAIIIKGTEQFSLYKGYGKGLKYGGNFIDKGNGTEIMGFDATNYSKKKGSKKKGKTVFEQWKRSEIDRELLKAYVAFSDSKFPLCSGNWGCGVFSGNLQLKFLQQWISASLCECKLIYCTFEFKKQELTEGIRDFTKFIESKKVEIYDLYKAIISLNQISKDKGLDYRKVDIFELLKLVLENKKIEKHRIMKSED